MTKQAQRELEDSGTIRNKIIEAIDKEENPKRLLIQYHAIVRKANKRSAQGRQPEADSLLDQARKASKKYSERSKDV